MGYCGRQNHYEAGSSTAPEIGNRYAIIINKVPLEILSELKSGEGDSVGWTAGMTDVVSSIFKGINEDGITLGIHSIPIIPKFERKHDVVIALHEFPGLGDFIKTKFL